MTKEQFDQKFEELIDQVPDILKKRADFLLKSGAIDLKDYEDDYQLPKLVLAAGLDETGSNFFPLHPKDKETLLNLLKF